MGRAWGRRDKNDLVPRQMLQVHWVGRFVHLPLLDACRSKARLCEADGLVHTQGLRPDVATLLPRRVGFRVGVEHDARLWRLGVTSLISSPVDRRLSLFLLTACPFHRDVSTTGCINNRSAAATCRELAATCRQNL